MRLHAVMLWMVVVGALTSWSPRAAVGQQLTLATRTPDFFYAPAAGGKPVEINVGHNAVLGQVVSLDFEHTTIGSLLAHIQRQTGLTFAYDPRFPVHRRVTLKAASITVAAALGAILVGTEIDVVLTPTRHVWLTETKPASLPIHDGMIAGRVTDKLTGNPIMGATVTLEPSRQTTATGEDGRYRFANLAAGNYRVRTRYIGYTPLVASVAIGPGQDLTVDFPLAKSAQPLEQVVVTGTILPTEARALPTPITVINAEEIAERHPHALSDVIRQAIPTAVAFNIPSQPLQTTFSVRGVSSLSGSSPLKIFVDGVEASTLTRNPVDPTSIERIEVVRGPQAATLYGADAAGGVVQIFTKRGERGLIRPQVDVQTGLGVAQTPYTGFGGVLRQEYTGSVRGSGQNVAYNLGAGYTRLADYAPPADARSSQTSPSVYGGIRVDRGILSADLSARYYRNKLPIVSNPLLLTAGFAPSSRQQYIIADFTNETYGARTTISPTGWWRNSMTLGVDRSGNHSVSTQPRFTTPADTFYTIVLNDSRKVSVGYNASAMATLGTALSGSLTAGVDHYDLDVRSTVTSRALTTQGAITTSPAGSFTESIATVKNTGYFAQVQVSVHEALFLTGGVRAEENSTFGQDLGTPVLPRVGLSLVQRVGQATLKVRGSYGKAIRAPAPGQAFGGGVSSTQINLANPLLGPERQHGWDAGVDLVFGNRGSLSVTGYSQRAVNLIADVQVTSTPLPTFQFQNIGRVSNKGVEVEGMLSFPPLHLRAQYGYVRSRIEDLGPGVSPGAALNIGDQPPRTPTHTAGATLTLAPRVGTTFTAGVTYVGSYRQADFLAQIRCFGGTGPCQPTARDYMVQFPDFAKVNVSFTQRITQRLAGFVSIDNLTNSQAYEGGNSIAVIGRTTMVGLHLSN